MTLRSFNPDSDLLALAAFLDDAARDDPGVEVSTEEELRVALQWPGHDLSRDRWVVERGGHLVAYGGIWKATASRRADVLLHILPGEDGVQDIRSLLHRAIERARELGARQAELYVAEENGAVASIARAEGFLPGAAYTLLEAGPDVRAPEVALPAPFSVRTYAEVDHLTTLVTAMNVSYGDLPGHHTVTEEDLLQWLSSWSLDGVFLVLDEQGEPAGVVRVDLRDENGIIDSPGVAPPYRHVPLRAPLLGMAMRYLRERGIARPQLESWGDDADTLALYTNLGFVTGRRLPLLLRDP